MADLAHIRIHKEVDKETETERFVLYVDCTVDNTTVLKAVQTGLIAWQAANRPSPIALAHMIWQALIAQEIGGVLNYYTEIECDATQPTIMIDCAKNLITYSKDLYTSQTIAISDFVKVKDPTYPTLVLDVG